MKKTIIICSTIILSIAIIATSLVIILPKLTNKQNNFEPSSESNLNSEPEILSVENSFETYSAFYDSIVKQDKYTVSAFPSDFQNIETKCECKIEFSGDADFGAVDVTINGVKHGHGWGTSKTNPSPTQNTKPAIEMVESICDECGFAKGANFIFIKFANADHGHGWSWPIYVETVDTSENADDKNKDKTENTEQSSAVTNNKQEDKNSVENNSRPTVSVTDTTSKKENTTTQSKPSNTTTSTSQTNKEPSTNNTSNNTSSNTASSKQPQKLYPDNCDCCVIEGDFNDGKITAYNYVSAPGINYCTHAWNSGEVIKAQRDNASSNNSSSAITGKPSTSNVGSSSVSTGVPPCSTCGFRRYTNGDGERIITVKCKKNSSYHTVTFVPSTSDAGCECGFTANATVNGGSFYVNINNKKHTHNWTTNYTAYKSFVNKTSNSSNTSIGVTSQGNSINNSSSSNKTWATTGEALVIIPQINSECSTCGYSISQFTAQIKCPIFGGYHYVKYNGQ